MSTKQNKFYETLRQTQANTFSDGLNMDLHPLTTPNTILTDCVNGTMITYNDNEFVLQNERGNNKIKIGDNDHVKLSEGFIPVGMKEHNGILYIVSHNPQTKQSEIGTFPSPNKQQEHGVTITFNGDGEYKANYNSFDQSIIYYDYNVIVTNQDNYTFESDHNSLIVLEHFILNKTGEVTKTKLIPTEENKVYRFTHEGEGTLGYRYRPYYLSSITPSIIPAKNDSNAQLVIEATSDDKELYSLLKNNNNIKFKYNIDIELVSETGDKLKYEVKNDNINFKSPQSLSFNTWDFTFNLSSVSKLPLQFENKFTINKVNYEYNYRTGEISSTNENNIIYKEVNFVITPCIYYTVNEVEYSIIYDNLITEYKTTASTVFKQESWFTMFKYTKPDEKDNKLNVYATLDLSRFDVNWETTIHTINDASYKLYEIDKYGNIKGKSVFTPVISYKSPLSNIVSDPLTMNSHDLFLNTEGEFNFKLSTSIDLLPVQYSYVNSNVEQCLPLTEDSSNKAKYVRYDVVDSKTYNVVLLREDRSIISSTNLWSENMCNEEMKKMIEEYFDKTTGTVNYTINDVEIEDNKIYLLELTFPINGEINKASFIIVTAPLMLDKYEGNNLEQRMDEILLTEWFVEPSVEEGVSSIKQDDYRNPSSYINNLIDVERIKNKTDDEIEKYAKQFFLKYNQLFTNPTDNEIPALGEQFNCEKTIKNTSAFDCVFEYNNALSLNEFNIRKTIFNALSLDVDTEKSKFYTQTSERKYLYDIFNDIKTIDVKSDGAYNEGDACPFPKITGGIIKLNSPEGLYKTYTYDGYNDVDNYDYDYLNYEWIEKTQFFYVKKRKGACGGTCGGEWPMGYTVKDCTTANHFGASLVRMKTLGLLGGFNYGNVKDLNKYVSYSGNNKKIWFHSKLRDKNRYVLLGIDALNSSEENSKLACNVLLKHGYYTKPCNKQVYQYVFKIENDIIKTKNIKTDNTSIPIKIYPGQCNALFNDYSQYNVQNWNNLSTLNFSSNYTINKFDVNDNIIDNENGYKYFLEKLGMLINNQLFDNNILQEQIIDNIIQFDVKIENLFIDDVNKINNKEGRNYSNEFYDMTMPELLYDKENKIIYCNINNNTVNQFEYSGGDCISPLKWNYSIPFDTTDGFWPDGSLDNIEKLNDYHSLLFYKLTAYNGEQSQNSN